MKQDKKEDNYLSGRRLDTEEFNQSKDLLIDWKKGRKWEFEEIEQIKWKLSLRDAKWEGMQVFGCRIILSYVI